MVAKVICDICGETDDWAIEKGKPFFPNGARGEFIDDNGGDRHVMTFDICQTCVEKHILPLFKSVHQDVLNNHPDYTPPNK